MGSVGLVACARDRMINCNDPYLLVFKGHLRSPLIRFSSTLNLTILQNDLIWTRMTRRIALDVIKSSPVDSTSQYLYWIFLFRQHFLSTKIQRYWIGCLTLSTKSNNLSNLLSIHQLKWNTSDYTLVNTLNFLRDILIVIGGSIWIVPMCGSLLEYYNLA